MKTPTSKRLRLLIYVLVAVLAIVFYYQERSHAVVAFLPYALLGMLAGSGILWRALRFQLRLRIRNEARKRTAGAPHEDTGGN